MKKNQPSAARVPRLFYVLIAFCLIVCSVKAQQDASSSGFDSASSLDSRLVDSPDYVMKRFTDAGMSAVTRHTLSSEERGKVTAALAELPPLYRRVLSQRLRTISFVDGIRGNGLTIITGKSPDTLYDIVIRAGILHETVSEFLTRKERNCFDTTGSSLSVSIEGGSMDAVLYIMLHEGSHVIDGSTRPSLDGPPMLIRTADPDPLTRGIWVDHVTYEPSYRAPVLDSIFFRTGKSIPIANAQAAYEALTRTPFVSLYGSSNWYDDVAELVTWYHLSQRLHQPYRIVLRNGDKTVYAYQPLTSPLVVTRFAALAPIYN
jgi:hypothetical protein